MTSDGGDRPCDRWPEFVVGDLPVCARHLRQVVRWELNARPNGRRIGVKWAVGARA